MHIITEEYSKIIITILCVSVFLTLFQHMVFGKNTNIKTVYQNQIVDTGIYTKDVTGQDFTIAPHFKSTENINTYKITNDIFTKNDALNIVHAYADEDETIDISNNVTILVYKYNIATKNVDDDGNVLDNPTVIFENVDATDKFGHKIYDDDGNALTTRQIKYDEVFMGELTDSNPIDTTIDSNMQRYKLVYRVSNNNLKAEYATLIIKEI